MTRRCISGPVYSILSLLLLPVQLHLILLLLTPVVVVQVDLVVLLLTPVVVVQVVAALLLTLQIGAVSPWMPITTSSYPARFWAPCRLQIISIQMVVKYLKLKSLRVEHRGMFLSSNLMPTARIYGQAILVETRQRPSKSTVL